MAEKKLWEVMADAAIASEVEHPIDLERRMASAAMLRAIADEVAPEEPEMPPQNRVWYPEQYQRWKQRMATRALLLQAAA